MTYAIITGAHLFPYSWLYKTNFYAIIAAVMSLGAFILAVNVNIDKMYLIPLLMSLSFLILTILLYFDYKEKLKKTISKA
jgi:hypothetical protein